MGKSKLPAKLIKKDNPKLAKLNKLRDRESKRELLTDETEDPED
jgi:hypothetical protein